LRWIARGFWQYNGELSGVGGSDEAAGFFWDRAEVKGF